MFYGRRFQLAMVVWSLIGASMALGQDAEPIEDPNLLPAQYVVPGGAYAPAGSVSSPVGMVADPPSPTVRVQVRVPASVAPNKELPYRIIVTNVSQADAYRVRIRDPLSDAIATITKIEPSADNFDPKKPTPLPKELHWSLGTLRPGESRTMELTITIKPTAKEIRNQAYVSFEHGQAVITKIERPQLAIRKSAPKQSTQTNGVAVVVEVSNPGRVPVSAVELVEDVSKGFAFTAGTTGEKGAEPTQRLWKLGTLQPGERKLIQYRLTAADGGELLASSIVKSPDVPEVERSESSTKVLVPGVGLELSGPPIVSPGEAGLYEIVARNTGTLPLTDVRISATIPNDCTISKMTRGGQHYRDRIVWTVSRMSPGEAYSVRYGLKANTTGKRTIRAAIEAAGSVEKSRELITSYQGTADLTWESSADPQTVQMGKTGLLTIRVRNTGGETAKNVRLRVELPADRAQFVQATPRDTRASANTIQFNEMSIPAYGSLTYTITYRAERAGQAWFRLRLEDHSLGDNPLTKEQAVEILGSR
ncbi:MAG: DUF11 domain-containing protein [Bacteroidales bacterium]|nr:DUF11 domain-containing protein [Bacteroidales bacterium]